MMVIAGYLCMVTGVSAAGYMIYTSCESATLETRPRTPEARWTRGLVLMTKNTDSLDTTGSQLLQVERASGCDDDDNDHQVLQAVWLQKRGTYRLAATWVVAVFLSLAFICYYLGLRSTKWWLSVAQLLVCLVSAFVRSVSKMGHDSYAAVDDIRLDKRCYSTGILDMQRASRISRNGKQGVAGEPSHPPNPLLDVRIYSIQSSRCIPLTGEFVAWKSAKLCLEPQYKATGDAILSAVGLELHFTRPAALPPPGPAVPGGQSSERKVVVVFQGGVVTEEGLAYPNATMCVAFPSTANDLAAPTPLLARGIMRQPEWRLERTQINKNTLPFMGGTYISSFDSMLTWWSIAEDRNEMGDQHKNLHGSFVLISTAFFLALLRQGSKDEELIQAIELAHRPSSGDDETYAWNLVDFLSKALR